MLRFKFSAANLRSPQLWLTVWALGLAPLPFGSVDQLWIAIWAILLSISTICGATVTVNLGQRRVLVVFLAVCCAYGLVAVVQVVPNLIPQLNDPIWQKANDLLALGALPRISRRAEIPSVAIGKFVLFVTSFMSGFFVGTSRRDSDTLILVARYSILLYAIYGLFAFVLTPDMILWAPKLAYPASLTATFVNHNTAATFFGAGAILWFSLVCLSAQSLKFSSLRLLLLIESNERYVFKIILQSLVGFVCLFALLLTGSRGGLVCTTLGMLVALGLMMGARLKPGFWYTVISSSAVLSAAAIWLSHTGRIASQGLFDDARWSVYEDCIRAIGERPLFGAGAGTFADLFPSLRDNSISSWGVWDYAHSTVLEIAVEMGIPIAATVVIAAAASVLILARAALKSDQRGRTLLSAIAGIAVLSYSHSMIDFSLQIPGYLIVFSILFGCGLARASSEHAGVRKLHRAGIKQSACSTSFAPDSKMTQR
jgi:O-antigen ligase